MERFNLKKLKKEEGKDNFVLWSQIELQLGRFGC
jgi:hypothetical protein